MSIYSIKNILTIIAISFLGALLFSCNSEQVVSNGLIQKRKYRKGLYFADRTISTSQLETLSSRSKRLLYTKDIKKISISRIERPTLAVNKLILPDKGLLIAKTKDCGYHEPTIRTNIVLKNNQLAKRPSTLFKSLSLNDGKKGKVTPTNYPPNDREAKRIHTYGILSLIFGIAGFIIPFSSIAAIVFGLLSSPDKLGKIGLILGIISLILEIIEGIVLILLIIYFV